MPSRSSSRPVALAATLVLTLPMCTQNGTETDNPLIDFEASACKTDAVALLSSSLAHSVHSAPPVHQGLARSGLVEDASRYRGLHCVAWQAREDGTLALEILNFGGGCGVEWEAGRARVSEDEVALTLRNALCAVAGCGGCIYDFAFEVEGVDVTRSLTLRLDTDDCERVTEAERLTLPLDEQAEGMVCREQASLVGLQLVCDGPHLPPCADRGVPECGPGACGDDPSLRCVEGALDRGAIGSYPLCLTRCEVDGDCGLELDTCRDGLCRLRETF